MKWSRRRAALSVSLFGRSFDSSHVEEEHNEVTGVHEQITLVTRQLDTPCYWALSASGRQLLQSSQLRGRCLAARESCYQRRTQRFVRKETELDSCIPPDLCADIRLYMTQHFGDYTVVELMYVAIDRYCSNVIAHARGATWAYLKCDACFDVPCFRALTNGLISNAPTLWHKPKFSGILYIVNLYGKNTWALTFENSGQYLVPPAVRLA